MKDSARTDNAPRLTVPGRWAVAALALTVLLVIVVRVRLLQIPLERDEGEYAYAGQLLLQGIPPYKLMYNMKLPGTYASYAAIMAVFGQTTAGIHLGFLLVNLGTLALLFFVARRLLDLEHAALACICYALLATSPGVLGLQGHATNLVVLAALGGLLLLLKARQSGRLWAFGCSGVVFGVSFVCKQPGLFFGLFALTVLLRDLMRAAQPQRGAWLTRLVFFGAGLASPFLLTCLLMSWTGGFHRFWFWTVVYARNHAGYLTWKQGLDLLGGFSRDAGAIRWSWVLPTGGLICLLLDKGRREARFIIGSLLAFSLIAFTASFYFTRHYFIMVLPALCLLIAIAERRAARAMGEAMAAGFLALACASLIFANGAFWFEQSPETACRSLYNRDPFPAAVQIAKIVRDHSMPADTIAVIGSEPEIYFYAHRHSATGYIYLYDLMQLHQYAPALQMDMMREIQAAKPAFLLLINTPVSEDADTTIVEWGSRYAKEYYDLAGTAWMLQDRTEYVWGQEALTRTYDTRFYVLILKRKPGV